MPFKLEWLLAKNFMYAPLAVVSSFSNTLRVGMKKTDFSGMLKNLRFSKGLCEYYFNNLFIVFHE